MSNFDDKAYLLLPNGHEIQESLGQKAISRNTELPKEVKDGNWEDLEGFGISRIKEVDDLFVEVSLPDGWSKVPCEHPMWTDLVDDKGRVRVKIFYKASDYDRQARLNMNNRYRKTVVSETLNYRWRIEIGHRHGLNYKDAPVEHVIESPDFPAALGMEEIERQWQLYQQQAKEWVVKNRPEWKDWSNHIDLRNAFCYTYALHGEVRDWDDKTVVYSTQTIESDEDSRQSITELLENEVQKWLDDNLPEWKKSSSYWDS